MHCVNERLLRVTFNINHQSIVIITIIIIRPKTAELQRKKCVHISNLVKFWAASTPDVVNHL